MVICLKCSVEMRCHKNDVTAVFAGDHCYSGDSYKCPECGNETLTGCGQPYFDPEALARGAVDMGGES